MKCPNCGATIEEGLGTCPECGIALSEAVLEPATDLEHAEGDVEPQDTDVAGDGELEESQTEDALQEEDEPSQEAVEGEASQELAEDELPQEASDGDEQEEQLEDEDSEEDAAEDDAAQAAPMQAAFDPTPEPFVVLTSSALNGMQQHCPHCGAMVYAGMRRCTRCGKRLIIQEEDEAEEGALRAAPLHEYKHLIGSRGVILVILLVLAGGYFATRLIPRLIEPLFDDAPTIVSGESIDHEINALLEESEQEGEQEAEAEAEAAPALSPDSLGQSWNGTYQGTNGSELVNRPLSIKINNVDNDGNVQATCVIGEEGYEGAIASYYVVGTIDWQTGDIELRGDEWIDSGELARMRMFRGTVDMDAGTITGTSSELDGSREGPWSMSLA